MPLLRMILDFQICLLGHTRCPLVALHEPSCLHVLCLALVLQLQELLESSSKGALQLSSRSSSRQLLGGLVQRKAENATLVHALKIQLGAPATTKGSIVWHVPSSRLEGSFDSPRPSENTPMAHHHRR